ncbi:MAG: hypothetical protein KKE50_05910 [Nanoarchaeota archaeon]|nr:hypothetical protein [Nanoarchaeota archaeon]
MENKNYLTRTAKYFIAPILAGCLYFCGCSHNGIKPSGLDNLGTGAVGSALEISAGLAGTGLSGCLTDSEVIKIYPNPEKYKEIAREYRAAERISPDEKRKRLIQYEQEEENIKEWLKTSLKPYFPWTNERPITEIDKVVIVKIINTIRKTLQEVLPIYQNSQ